MDAALKARLRALGVKVDDVPFELAEGQRNRGVGDTDLKKLDALKVPAAPVRADACSKEIGKLAALYKQKTRADAAAQKANDALSDELDKLSKGSEK